MKCKLVLNLGDVIDTSNTGSCTVISIENQNVTVVFPTGFKTTVKKGNLIKGSVRDPLFPSVFDKGYGGVGEYVMHKNLRYYKWRNMLTRCYSKEYKELHPTYDNVECDSSWLNYQVFAEWFDKQGFTDLRFDLDKDWKVLGNKIYSESTASFIPQELNKITKKGSLGISTRADLNGKWMVRFSKGTEGEVYLGCHEYDTALSIYKKAKTAHIQERALFWEDKIDKQVFNNLMTNPLFYMNH
jgi:hypothetical protein